LNARFGGGAPLSIAAGADFPRWLLEELEGTRPTIVAPGFNAGILMLRFDDAVFVEGGDALLRSNIT
ncbi:MAG: carbamoyl-phosphate synthase large subunit, partial [Myxococcota bacterium]